MSDDNHRSDLAGTPWENNPNFQSGQQPKEKSKRSIFTSLAFVSVIGTVLTVMVGMNSQKGIDGPGGMVDLSFLVSPVLGVVLGGPVAVILSVLALARGERYSLWVVLILIPVGILGLVLMRILTT